MNDHETLRAGQSTQTAVGRPEPMASALAGTLEASASLSQPRR